MTGTNRNTGKPLSGIAHLRQSIADILTTPIGSRVMRPTYGSRLFELVDAPLTQETQMQIASAVADALSTWEPRVHLLACKLYRMDGSRPVFMLTAAERDATETSFTTQITL